MSIEMPEGRKDFIEDLCIALGISTDHVFTFKDFINEEYSGIKSSEEINRLRKAWNIGCDVLLSLLVIGCKLKDSEDGNAIKK